MTRGFRHEPRSKYPCRFCVASRSEPLAVSALPPRLPGPLARGRSRLPPRTTRLRRDHTQPGAMRRQQRGGGQSRRTVTGAEPVTQERNRTRNRSPRPGDALPANPRGRRGQGKSQAAVMRPNDIALASHGGQGSGEEPLPRCWGTPTRLVFGHAGQGSRARSRAREEGRARAREERQDKGHRKTLERAVEDRPPFPGRIPLRPPPRNLAESR